jgi:hypothetical protein
MAELPASDPSAGRATSDVCTLVGEMFQQDSLPSVEQLQRYQQLAPHEIAGPVNLAAPGGDDEVVTLDVEAGDYGLVVRACANDADGQLRVVADGEAWSGGEYPLQWWSRGPVGPTGPAGLTVVAGSSLPKATSRSGPVGGTDFTVARLGAGLHTIDIAAGMFAGQRCPVTIAQSSLTEAYIKVSGRSCDPSGSDGTLATRDGTTPVSDARPDPRRRD